MICDAVLRDEFLAWASMYGGSKDLQWLLDAHAKSGDYPEEFLIYMSDREEFEKTGHWPERNFD